MLESLHTTMSRKSVSFKMQHTTAIPKAVYNNITKVFDSEKIIHY